MENKVKINIAEKQLYYKGEVILKYTIKYPEITQSQYDIGKQRFNHINRQEALKFQKNKTYPFATGQFFLRRFEDGGFLAMSVKCTHLGCVVNSNLDTGGFNCPCHRSQFNRFGEVLMAPATRPLDLFPITIVKGELFIDTQAPVKRTSFEKSQLTYA